MFDSHRFGQDTPVLRLTRGKDPGARWVLWPVFAWRVVAPVPLPRKLNVFQRAVLGLARAGIRRLTDVADRLLIAPDLAGVVALELQNMGMLEHDGAPTKRGLDLLEEVEDEPADEARVGFVIADAFTGKLWPRFLAGDLPLADVEPDDNGWPVLLSGSAGDPWKDRPYSLLPGRTDSVVAARPTARDILNAVRRHRRQRRFEAVRDDRDVPALKRVSFVDERPQPYLFALRARRFGAGDWAVDDPFGHGDSVELRSQLEERLDRHRGLRGWLAPLIGAESEGSQTLAELQTEAAWLVEERLTLSIRSHPVVLERLVAMQRAYLEACREDAPADKWDDVLVKAQKAMERTLKDIHAPFAGAEPPRYLELDWTRRLNREPVDAAAAAAGFDTPLPASLSEAHRGKVQNTETRGGGSLRPLLVLNVLCARWEEEHPLRHASASEPRLLHRLDAMAGARDRAAHEGSETWADQVGRHTETAFIAVERLLLEGTE